MRVSGTIFALSFESPNQQLVITCSGSQHTILSNHYRPYSSWSTIYSVVFLCPWPYVASLIVLVAGPLWFRTQLMPYSTSKGAQMHYLQGREMPPLCHQK